MKWHIVTGSKGGVGKTLLSLLLLAHCLEKEQRQQGSTLILDLNGMNTDSSALILYRNRVGQKETTIPLETEVTLYHQGANVIKLQTVEAIDSQQQQQTQKYAVGWPQNPFALMNPQLFADLLCAVTLNAQTIETQLEFTQPLRHIIIDTNYHFCNIFAQDEQEACYGAYRDNGTLCNEEINIWFLWVYRQLEKLLDDSNEAATIRTTAATIEKLLKGFHSSETITPLIHVFTPVGLMTSPPPTGILSSLFSAQQNKKDYIISEFASLEDEKKVPKRESIKFENWIVALNAAYNSPEIVKKNQERATLFPEVLREVVTNLGNQRPRNVIPVSVYENALQHYTDKERPDAVARLRGMKIYQHLSTLLK